MHIKLKNIKKTRDERGHTKILIGMVGVYDENESVKGGKAKHKAFIPLDDKLLSILENIEIPLNFYQIDALREIIRENK